MWRRRSIASGGRPARQDDSPTRRPSSISSGARSGRHSLARRRHLRLSSRAWCGLSPGRGAAGAPGGDREGDGQHGLRSAERLTAGRLPMFGFNVLVTVLVFFLVPIVFFILILAVAKRYRKVGPNQVMVISGRRHRMKTADGRTEVSGYRIRQGGGAFIFPLLERVDALSLEVMTLDITTPEVYTKPGVP